MGGTRDFATIFNTVIHTRLTTLLVRGKDTVLHLCRNFTYKEKRPWFSETTYLSYSTPAASCAQCQHEHLAPCSSPTTANFITTNFSNKTFLTKEKPNQYLSKKSSAKGHITTTVFLKISSKPHETFPSGLVVRIWRSQIRYTSYFTSIFFQTEPRIERGFKKSCVHAKAEHLQP